MKAYLRSQTDHAKFTDFGDYSTLPPFPAPSGFEWIEGELPDNAAPYVAANPLDLMTALVVQVPPEVRAQFAPYIASVDVLAKHGDYATIRILLQGLSLPAPYTDLPSQLLACLPAKN